MNNDRNQTAGAGQRAIDYEAAGTPKPRSRALILGACSLVCAFADVVLLVLLPIIDHLRFYERHYLLYGKLLDALATVFPWLSLVFGIFGIGYAFYERRYSALVPAMVAIVVSLGFVFLNSLGPMNPN